MSEQEQLLAIADDELVLGWRDSEWTGIAPVLEEDVALSSIAQNEIGHARALYQLLADDADALAFDRAPGRVPLLAAGRAAVRARLGADDRAAGAVRGRRRAAPRALKASGDPAVAGLAAKIDREEAYHRMHAELWHDRLRDEPRFREAVVGALAVRAGARRADDRAALSRWRGTAPRRRVTVERGAHAEGWPELWDEMTEVRRSVPGATW